MKSYIKAIGRRLNLPRDVKKRVLADLTSTIRGRMESGETEEQIRGSLGSPKEVARGLNQQMSDYVYRKSPWRWACLALAVICIAALCYHGLVGLALMMLNRSIQASGNSLGVIGGADGPTAIFVTTKTASTPVPEMLVWVLGALVGVVGYWILRHQKNQGQNQP